MHSNLLIYRSLPAKYLIALCLITFGCKGSSGENNNNALAYNALKSWYLNNGSNNGNGSHQAPFNSFKQAMQALRPGDTLFIMPGNYKLTEAIVPQHSGTAHRRITIKGFDPANRPVLMPTQKRAILIQGLSHYRFQDIEINGNFVRDQLVIMRNGNANIEFVNCKIGRSSADGFAISESDNVLFDNCEIYYCVNFVNNRRKDAHGIMYRSGSKLVVNNCNIHHVTGDGIQ
ncbi:MAG: right-handed parallel beta-helix repeat-containing protein [Bacteroidales bacterium]|nr:right-handed parallel beta-helix repeat-containing protein [Bacteroidales bacterium]